MMRYIVTDSNKYFSLCHEMVLLKNMIASLQFLESSLHPPGVIAVT